MIEKICIIIILILSIYQLYNDVMIILNNRKVNEEKEIQSLDSEGTTTDEELRQQLTREHKKQPENVTDKVSEEFTEYNNLANFDDYDYGKPHKIIEGINGNRQYLWEFSKPLPWSKITYNPKSNYNYNYYIIIKIPSSDLFNKWLKIIPNLKYKRNINQLIIPSNDEEGALTLANLIINNLNNNISLNDIVKNNLILDSIIKAKKHKMFKNKLKNQINEIIYGFKTNDSREDFSDDLALSNNNLNDLGREKIDMPPQRIDERSFNENFKNNTQSNSIKPTRKISHEQNQFEKITNKNGLDTTRREVIMDRDVFKNNNTIENFNQSNSNDFQSAQDFNSDFSFI